MADVAEHEDVQAPGQTATVNEDGTVRLEMTNPNPADTSSCMVGIAPALDAPVDGVQIELGIGMAIFDTDKVINVPKLDPGVYAVSSYCSVWESDQAREDGESPIGTTANQPHYFVTLGGLF